MALPETPNRNFETRDTALVAYLLTEGFPEPEVRHTEDGCVFTFCPDGDDGQIHEPIKTYVRQFLSGKANGNLAMFYYNYKRVIRRVHTNNW